MDTQNLETIRVESDGTVVTVSLNRPERLNALNTVMIGEMTETLRKANSDSNIRVIILSGTGDRSFCSGADLTQQQLGKAGQYDQHLRDYYHPMLRCITDSSKPYIAALNGAAVGAGIGLALACDYIIAVSEVEFHMAFARIGLVPDTGVMSFITNHIGRQRAFDWAATGGKITANDALNYGMINEIAETETLFQAARNKANFYTQMPKMAVGLIKKMSHAALSHSLEEMLDLERDLQEKAAAEPDHMEGVRAFLEKRKPNFT